MPPAGDAHAARQALADAVRAFRGFVATATVGEPETAMIVTGLEQMLATLPGVPAVGVAALLALLRLPVPEMCRTAAGAFEAYQKKGKWQAAAKGVTSKAEAAQLFDAALAHYTACRDAHTALRESAAGGLLALLGSDVMQVAGGFQRAKHAAALLDFDDLLHHARTLLAARPDVRVALAQRYRHVLVDEFQDTDPVQVEILWRLCGDPPQGAPDAPWHRWRLRDGALFMVGDPKQAIYRFRGADVRTYLRARAALLAADPGHVLQISRNFRAVAPILDWVNDRFHAPLAAPGQPGFVPLFGDQPAPGGRASVRALDIAVPDGASVDAKRAAEAAAVADICVRLIGAWQVREPGGTLRPCRAGDIVLLAPVGTDLWQYERALEDRALPVATQAGKGFFHRQEVQDLIALACVLADASDTLALGALLRGPLVGLTEEALLDAVEAVAAADTEAPRLRLWLPVAHLGAGVLRDTLAVLQGLARRARSATPYLVLAQAVDELRVRPLLRQRSVRSAERALANVEVFLDLARAYETRGLHAFAQAMRGQWAEAERAPEARPDAEAQAVSLITMHSAKGLEWPVVIPVNTAGRPESPRLPVLDRDAMRLHLRLFGVSPPGCAAVLAAEAAECALERQRLWYVATTRARDLLLLPRLSCGTAAGSWMAAVDLALPDLAGFDATSLPPATLPRADEPANAQDRPRFVAEAAAIAAATPSLRRLTPSRAEADDAAGGDVIGVLPPSDLPQPVGDVAPAGGRGRGLVLHKLIEEVLTGELVGESEPLMARGAELAATCEAAADRCDPAELAATILRTLGLPEVAALRARLVAELPVHAITDTSDGPVLLAGVADAAAVAPDGSIAAVIDWKSDVAPTPETVAGYQQQVRLYMRALDARRGLIVFMTSGLVLPVSAAPA